VSKVKFKRDGDRWVPDEANKALIWQQGVMVIGITDTHVHLGSCREPLGSLPRTNIVDAWLDINVEMV